MEVFETISDYVEECKEHYEEEYSELLRDLHEDVHGEHFNEHFAICEVNKMFHKDKEGNKHTGPHWTKERTDDVFNKIKSKIPQDYNTWDWYVTLNMIYHDNIVLVKGWFPEEDESKHTERIVEMAVNWLNDSDDLDGKIWCYFN